MSQLSSQLPFLVPLLFCNRRQLGEGCGGQGGNADLCSRTGGRCVWVNFVGVLGVTGPYSHYIGSRRKYESRVLSVAKSKCLLQVTVTSPNQ